MLHLPAHGSPLGLRDARRDPAVGNDLNDPVGHQQIDEHAVVIRGIPDAELAEQLQRALPRWQIVPQRRQLERRLDDEADLPRMTRLAFADRLLDRPTHCRGEVPAREVARGAEVAKEARESYLSDDPTAT